MFFSAVVLVVLEFMIDALCSVQPVQYLFLELFPVLFWQLAFFCLVLSFTSSPVCRPPDHLRCINSPSLSLWFSLLPSLDCYWAGPLTRLTSQEQIIEQRWWFRSTATPAGLCRQKAELRTVTDNNNKETKIVLSSEFSLCPESLCPSLSSYAHRINV